MRFSCTSTCNTRPVALLVTVMMEEVSFPGMRFSPESPKPTWQTTLLMLAWCWKKHFSWGWDFPAPQLVTLGMWLWLVTRMEAYLAPLLSPFPRKKVFPSTRHVACVCLVRADDSSCSFRSDQVLSLQAYSSLSIFYRIDKKNKSDSDDAPSCLGVGSNSRCEVSPNIMRRSGTQGCFPRKL